MAKSNTLDRLTWGLYPLAAFGMYLAVYLLSTDVFAGRMGDNHYRIRLFRSMAHYQVFEPLLAIEARLRPANPQFSGQVHSGASLPPPEETYEDEK